MFLKLYCIALPIFFGLDMVWLGVAAKNFYTKQIGFLMTPKVNWVAAILFYLLFLAGLVVLVLLQLLKKIRGCAHSCSEPCSASSPMRLTISPISPHSRIGLLR